MDAAVLPHSIHPWPTIREMNDERRFGQHWAWRVGLGISLFVFRCLGWRVMHT
jgi:hypothetical protein